MTTVGPLLTLMLLVGLVLAVRGRSRGPADVALLLGLAYVGTADFHRGQALDAQAAVAASRGHAVARAEMFPTVGNPFVWRSVYESAGRLHMDRVRVVGRGAAQWKAGSDIPLLREAEMAEAFAADDRIRRDFARFRFFSAGWLARAKGDSTVIGDARCYLLSNAP